MIPYGFHKILSDFHMSFIWIIIIMIILIIIIIIIILEVGPHFSNVPFFWLLTFFQISNVRPEIPTTTEIFEWHVFFDC